MAPKLKPDPIGVSELKRYLETESDFDFELRVLKELRDFGLDCEHGGHYEDPVTKKSREFDIRMHVADGRFNLFAAIECKNLRPNFPLLVSCVPRTDAEAWHQVAQKRAVGSWTKMHIMRGDYSLYRPRGIVGKSTVQVGITPAGEMLANDAEVYEKWGQSLASLHGFARRITGLPDGSVSMALPIVVVPDGNLWHVLYRKDGQRMKDPEPTDRCSVYAGGFEIPLDAPASLRISHVEIMTLDGLLRFCSQHLCDESSMETMILGGHALD